VIRDRTILAFGWHETIECTVADPDAL